MTPREFDAATGVGLAQPSHFALTSGDRRPGRTTSVRRLGGRPSTRFALVVVVVLLVSGSLVGFLRRESAQWQQVFADDFGSTASLGEFTDSSYATRWSAYDGFTDTSGNGRYSSSALSVGGGALDMYLHTQDGQPQSAAVVPLVNGQWGGQLYGRYTIRFRSEQIPGFKMAFLLWPDSDNWAEGEIDFPEISSLEAGETLYANVYPKGDLASGYPGENSTFSTDTQAVDSGWHTAAIEWAPDSITFVLDGQVLGTVTEGVPDTLMHLVLQVETVIDAPKPDSDAAGHLQVDWVRIDSYVGS